MSDPERSADGAEGLSVDQPAINTLASAKNAYRRIVEALSAGVAATFHGPSAEGITLYAGLSSHRQNGSIPQIVDEAITTLASDAEPSVNDD